MSRWARKIDTNQPEVVKHFRKLGCTVAVTSHLGQGFPDLVIGCVGRSSLVEVKDGSKPPSARKLTGDEQEFKENWRGDYYIVETLEDVEKLVNDMRKRKR